MPEHVEWLRGEIRRKEEEVEGEEQALKEMNYEIITEEKRHLFYLNKVRHYKEGIERGHNERKVTHTPGSVKVKGDSIFEARDSGELTESELLYFYDPQKEMERYREVKEEELRLRVNGSREKKEFALLLERAQESLGKSEFNLFEQEFYDLIVE